MSMQNWARLIVEHRGWAALLMLLVTAAAIWGHLPDAPRIGQRKSAEIELERDPQMTRAERLTNSFDLARSEAFLVIECDDFFRRETIVALREMERQVESLPHVDTVFWIDDIPMINAFGFADPLLPADDASPESFAEARQRTLEHPLVVGQLLSDDAHTLMMPVTFDWLFVTSDEEVDTGLIEVAQQAIAEALQAYPESDRPTILVRLTGNVPIFLAQKSAFDRNQGLFRWLGYGMVFALAVLMFRGLSAVLVVAGAPALGAFWCFGLLSLFSVELNSLANVVLPVLISMIGFTDGVHLMVHIRRLRAAGHSERDAARLAIEQVGLACWLTSLTTAIGFASLLLAESEFVRDFGFVCAIGVLVTFVAVVLFIPLVSSTRVGRNIHRGHERDIVGGFIENWGGAINWVLKRRVLVSLLGTALTVLFGCISLQLRPDSQLANSMPASSPAYQTLAHCDEAFGGIEFIQVVVTWPGNTPDDSIAILSAIADIERMVQDEPLVRHPLSVRSMLATFPGDPEDLQTRMTFVSLIPPDLRRLFFRTDTNEAVVILRIQDRGIAAYEPVFQRLEIALGELAKKYRGFQFEFRGAPVQRARDLFRIVVDLSTSLITAALIILAVLTFVYQSWRIGLISVVPNMFPLAVTASVLVAMGRPLNIASVCAFVVCLGIAVDDTIHFLSRYRLEIAVDGDIDAAIRRAFQGVATALVMTTVILVAGFGTVLLSDLPGHRIFAAMACSTIGSALVGDLFFLPALLAWSRQK